MGVVSGIPDVFAIRGGKVYALELKSEIGRLSVAQERVLGELRAAGCDAECVRGLDAAIAWLENRGLLRGRAGY
jgi:hypothetical protein